MNASDKQYNDLCKFLIGKWNNVSFEIANKEPIKREEYSETIIGKDYHTIEITAHGFKNGKDITKAMYLKLEGNNISMEQGLFKATGRREGNVYTLKGTHDDKEFRFRLYTMVDKYVFHRETWLDGQIQQIDMSYLIRKP